MAWQFCAGFTEEEFVKLVSPRLVTEQEAKAITWGGAAACNDCKFKRKYYEQETGKDARDLCIDNLTGGCRFPAPSTMPSLVPFWRTWSDSRYPIVTAGMDAVPAGRDPRAIELAASAHGEPLDALFLERLAVIQDAWLLGEAKRRKAEAEAAKHQRK